MPDSALVFDDRDALADFLTEGEPISVANYLLSNQRSLKDYLEQTSGYEVDIAQMSEMLKSGNEKSIADCRKFFIKCISENFDGLPLTEDKNRVARTAIPAKVERSSSSLRSLLFAAPLVLAAGFAISFIDFDKWFPDGSSPNDGAELSEPFDEAALPSSPQSDAAEITDEIEDALTPFDHTVGEFDTYDVPGLMQNEDGEIFYYDWFVENDVYEANVLTSQITGVPLSYSFAVQALESSLNPRAINGIQACGLSQFVPDTLAEYGYRFAPLIGYEGVRDNLILREREKLEGTNSDGDPLYNLTYDYASMNAQHSMVHACYDPHFNTRLAAVLHLREIGSLQRDLAEFAPEGMEYFPVTELQGYIAHFAGGSGGERILRDLLSNEGASEAREFFSAGAASNAINQRLLFHPKTVTDEEGNAILDDEGNIQTVPDLENPRTVAEFVSFLGEDKGLSDTPLPNFTDWSALSERITNNMQSLGVSPVTVQLSYEPAFDIPTPNMRPQRG